MSGDPLADAMRREWKKRHDPDYDPEDRDAKSICDHLADAIREGALAEALADVPAKALGFQRFAGDFPYYLRGSVNVGSTSE